MESITSNVEGVVYYNLLKQNATTYVILEKYKDEVALDAHRKTDYYKSFGTQLGAIMQLKSILGSVSSTRIPTYGEIEFV